MQEHIQLSLCGAYRSSNKAQESALQNGVFWKVRGRQNEGHPVGKGLLLEAEPACLGLDWNPWLIVGQAENSVGTLDSACSRAKKVSAEIFLLQLHVHVPYWISYLMVEDEEIENRRECGEDRTERERREGRTSRKERRRGGRRKGMS